MSRPAYLSAAVPGGRVAAGRRGAADALAVAIVCLLAMALLWLVAEHVPAVQVRDAAALRDFTLLDGSHVAAASAAVIRLLNPLPFTLFGLALALIALARGRPRVAVAVVFVMLLAPLSADWLKPLLAHPHPHAGVVHIGPASWPSGHSAAALALALCAVLVAPRHLRALTAVIGAAFAVAVGCALLISAWHMPSDVLGGYLVAAVWMALAVAALRAADRRWPVARRAPA